MNIDNWLNNSKKYNKFKSSQSRPTASQYARRPNLDAYQSDFQETKASSQSWKDGYSTTNRSKEANELSATRSKRRKSQPNSLDPASMKDLEKLRKEMQLLKKVWLGQDANQDMDSNPLSLEI